MIPALCSPGSAHLSGNCSVICPDDNQSGRNVGALGRNVYASGRDVDAYRLDADTLYGS